MASLEETLNILRQSLDRVLPALEILDGFNHRNKNQHRLSKWWAEFGTLRRHLGKFAVESQANADKLERYAKYKKKPPRKGYEDDVNARVEHIQHQLLPRAFLAFTQLAADNQYAHLGLVLLGVLAQVEQALRPLMPEQAPAASVADVSLRNVVDLRMSGGLPAASTIDMGVAVSRDDLVTLTKSDKGDHLRKPHRHESEDKRLMGEQPLKDKKKKTSRKAGDEFDTLFGSLDTKAPKKKKRKKADEFDDLFGSLL